MATAMRPWRAARVTPRRRDASRRLVGGSSSTYDKRRQRWRQFVVVWLAASRTEARLSARRLNPICPFPQEDTPEVAFPPRIPRQVAVGCPAACLFLRARGLCLWFVWFYAPLCGRISLIICGRGARGLNERVRRSAAQPTGTECRRNHIERDRETGQGNRCRDCRVKGPPEDRAACPVRLDRAGLPGDEHLGGARVAITEVPRPFARCMEDLPGRPPRGRSLSCRLHLC